jgi:hypothetical protein
MIQIVGGNRWNTFGRKFSLLPAIWVVLMIPKMLVIIISTLFMHKQPCQIIKTRVKEARRLVQNDY